VNEGGRLNKTKEIEELTIDGLDDYGPIVTAQCFHILMGRDNEVLEYGNFVGY